MARRRKKSRAAAAAKTQKDGSSPMIKDKVLPALPPNMTEGYTDEPPQDSPNELSPRMRSGSRSNDTPPRAIPARSPERPAPTEQQPTKSDSLMLPASAYRKNRNSALIGSPDGKPVDPVELYGSLVRDSSPSAGGTPASGTDRRKESDYFPTSRSSASDNREGSQASTPHIAFQEKSREPSSDSVSRPGLRRHSKSDKMSPDVDDFKMTDISKTRALASSRSNSLSASGTPEVSASSKFNSNNGPSPRRPSNYQRASQDGTSDEGTSAITSPDLSKGSLKSETKAFARKELPPSAVARSKTGPPDAYTRPRNAPAPPGSRGSMGGTDDDPEPKHSPKLPRWSSGADFSLDEDMARILGTDEGSSSLLRRVSNVVRHGRSGSAESHQLNHRISHSRSISETTRTTMSPRWPKSPIREDGNSGGMDPMSMKSMEEATILKRQLRNSENRVAELERRFDTEKDLQNLNRTLTEKRKTVSALDTQAELMIKQLEVLGGYVERAKATKTPINPRDLEDSAIRDFVQRLEAVKQDMAGEIEELHQKRAQLLEERELAMADRDRALMEFEQLSSKNAQLADMNNDLTHQIQGRFKSQVSDMKNSNGLGIYANSRGAHSGANIDSASMSTGPTLIADDDTIVESGPTVVQVRKGQVKKFNWKKGSKAMAQNMAKGMNRAVVAFQNDRERIQQQGVIAGGDIGMPYNATVAQAELVSTPISANGGGRPGNLEPGRQGFGFFGKKNQMPKSVSANTMPNSAAAEPASVLFGSELTDRADFEHRQIPSVVTRCIEEVELRGMDQEGIYRKTGGNSQVNAIKDGFDRDENFDISDTDLDITAVTSVLKQYFRKLPTPLLTFDVYDNVLESNGTFSHLFPFPATIHVLTN